LSAKHSNLRLASADGAKWAGAAGLMRSLGREPRAFPKGHIVEQGNWSLLDPVRARPPVDRLVERIG